MSESLDDSVESSLLGVFPCPFVILAKEGGERSNYVSIVRHELLIEVGESSEDPDVSDILLDGPFHQRGYLFGLSSYPPSANAKADKIDFFGGKFTLAAFDKELVLAEARQNGFDVCEAFEPSAGEDDYIVHIDSGDVAHVVDGHVRRILECAVGVLQSERHNKPLKRTPFRLEGSFVDIFLRDANLVKSQIAGPFWQRTWRVSSCLWSPLFQVWDRCP